MPPSNIDNRQVITGQRMALEGQRPWESALNLRLGNDLLPVEGLRSRGEHQVDGKRFDVWVDIGGATVAVEAKLGFHHQQAAARAAAERLEDGLADAAVAVCYPDRLTDLSFPPFFGGLVYAALASSYSIGESMSALEWRRWRLYHWSIQAAMSRRAWARVG